MPLLTVNFTDPRIVNVVRLFVLCMVFSFCCPENAKVDDLKEAYTVREDHKKGTPLFCAYDPYSKIEKIDIPINPFKPLKTIVERNDGSFCVILDDVLSFKVSEHEYLLDLQFYGDNNQLMHEKRVIIKLHQVNRYPPRFEPYDDTLSLKEEVENGHGELLTLKATDEDFRDALQYDIKNLENLDKKFNIRTSPDGNSAVLMNKEKLDFEIKTYYRIEAIVVDNINGKILYGGQHTSTAVIHVNVIDIDDQPPVFQKECGMAKIKEHTKDDVARVHAIDGDRGINNPIGYALGNVSAEEFFSVTRQSVGDAIVAVTNDIDREDPRFITNPLITFSIQADEYYNDDLTEIVMERRAFSICTVIIEDINDNPPEFSKQRYLATVKENTQIGIPVSFPKNELPSVTDIDEGENAMFELYLENNNETFTVTPTEGINNVTFLLRVNNVTALDYERPDLHEPKYLQLQIVAKEKTESNRHSSTAAIIVELEDENDNYPQFISPEKANISENASEGDIVAKIQAFDIDSEWFGTKGIRYSLMPSHISSNFSLNQETGELTVGTDKHGFDRETTEIHYLTIEARDNNGTGNRNTTQLQVELLDANDNAPIFLFSSYRSQLMENSVNFTDQLKLEANDRDKENTPNSEVRYVITGGDKWKQFQIDEKEGTLTPRMPLDFEDEERVPELDKPCISVCTRTYELIVTAHDLGEPRQSSNVPVYITLQDENDNTPEFSESYVTATINETSPQGTAVTRVQAIDLDISPIYKNVSYSIIRGGEGNFVIDRNSGNIIVARNADLDVSYNATKKRRLLLIEASDAMMKSSTCEVMVNITDINDKKPNFRKLNTTEYEVLENVKDILIGKFPADDPDETALLDYSINYDESIALKPDLVSRVDEKYNYSIIFEINNEGELSVINPADREEMKQITLVLKVVDLNAEVNIPQVDTLTIKITILDVNDNDPEFVNAYKPPKYEGKVRENVKDIVLFNIRAFDIDENNTIIYKIEGDEKVHKHFELNATLGELRVISEIDYEEDQNINFTAVAIDSGVPPRNASAGVFIEIIDENDNSPQFEDQPYQNSIDEHVPEGTFVIQLNASDEDSGDYGLVYFRIPKLDEDDDYFSIEKETGVIRVKGDLDREKQEVFKINVQAYDNPNDTTNQRTNNTKVTVTLLDINDHAPVIDVNDDCLNIPENTPVNNTLVKITATDKDKENTPNSEIEFFIEEEGYFEITLNGTLFVNTSLKDLHEEFQVIVMAKDKGLPPLNSTQPFCIKVYDVNTHKPKFVRPLPNETDVVLVVDEKTERKKEVYVFEAKDDDNNKETNGKVSYRLLGEEFQADKGDFIIHDEVGTLRVNAQLDKGLKPDYKIEVEACDNGEPKLCADHAAILHVYIKSETDAKPHFIKSNDEVRFTEHSKPGEEKQFIPKAELKEKYVENVSIPICYYIVEGDTKLFNLDKNTRILTLLKDVDREHIAFHFITIQAETDCLNEPPKSSKTSLTRPDIIKITVRILDINDNPPIFTEKEFYGGVNTKDKAGKHILTIYATDADEGENAVITYLIVGEINVNNGEGLDKVLTFFNLNETTGAITLAFQPPSDAKGHFTFTVMAKDIGDLNDTAQVSVYLMRSDQQIRLIIAKNVNEITENDISHLRAVLMEVTNYIVNIDDIASYSGSDPRYKSFTEVFIHCVDRSSNEVIESDKAIRSIDQNYRELVKKIDPAIGLIGGQKYIEEKQKQSLWENHGDHILFGIIGILSFFIFLLLIVYFIRISSYKRFLKAATAKAFGPDDSALKDFSKTVVPNTNLHTIQGSNPIWNQEDEIMKKFCEEETLSENGSTNSLDINVIEPPTVEDNCKENPLFSNEDETPSLNNRKDSIELSPESPAIFGQMNYTHQPSPDLGSRLSVLREIDSDWRRRLTNGSITPIKSQQNFTFGKSPIGEADEV